MSPQRSGLCAAVVSAAAAGSGLIWASDAAPWLASGAWLALLALVLLGISWAGYVFTAAALGWRRLEQSGPVPEQERVP